MEYLLSQQELDGLTSVTRLQARNEALEVAKNLIISDEKCIATHYCCDCPIGQIEDQKIRNHICLKPKHWPK